MVNALYWMFGVSASILVVAYLVILASVVAAKRRMAACESVRPSRHRVPVGSMSFRTP
jgi:hypothetical protein